MAASLKFLYEPLTSDLVDPQMKYFLDENAPLPSLNCGANTLTSVPPLPNASLTVTSSLKFVNSLCSWIIWISGTSTS